MPGPRPNPAKPHSRHRRRGQLLVLPAECTLPPPKLPQGRRWSAAERRLWAELWGSPQASQWDDSYGAAVAQYVVHAAAVLAGSASAWQATEARHLGDRLGLTPSGLAALGWALAEPNPSPLSVLPGGGS